MNNLIEAPSVTVEDIDIDGGPPCDVRPGGNGPCCGRTAVARVRVFRPCCGINNILFICAPCLAEVRKSSFYCAAHLIELTWKET